MMRRFKIDFSGYTSQPFGLFFGRPRFGYTLTGLMKWERVEFFQTREDAVKMHEKIKDLPQYLD